MANHPPDTERAKTAVKESLLADFRHLSESLWKSEQTGETRVNLFTGFVTVVMGALVTLVTRHPGLEKETLRAIVLASLLALMVLGFITLLRILKRNASTDRYTAGLDATRQIFRDHFDGAGVLFDHYCIGGPTRGKASSTATPPPSASGVLGFVEWCRTHRGQVRPRRFGGLAHTMAAINSLLLGGFAATSVFPIGTPNRFAQMAAVYVLGIVALIFGFASQVIYITWREVAAKNKLRASRHTHAGGVVFKVVEGLSHYLLVQSKDGHEEWVLPKGHIEYGEGHAEAAVREVREETGAVTRPVTLLDSVSYSTEKGGGVKVKFYLLKGLYEGHADESRKIRWCPFEEALEKLIHLESRHVLREGHKRCLELECIKTSEEDKKITEQPAQSK